MEPVAINVTNLSDLPLPQYQTAGSAGFDLLAAIDKPVTIEPGTYAMIPTGIKIALPAGFELQIRARSGLAAKHGVGLTNGVGTIDSDYRGEIGVLLSNHGAEPFVINRGDRIAQGVVAQYQQITWQLVQDLDKTTRASGGFGSTGK